MYEVCINSIQNVNKFNVKVWVSQVPFSAPTWQHTTVYNSSLRISDTLFLLSMGIRNVHTIQTHVQEKHNTNKIIK